MTQTFRELLFQHVMMMQSLGNLTANNPLDRLAVEVLKATAPDGDGYIYLSGPQGRPKKADDGRLP